MTRPVPAEHIAAVLLLLERRPMIFLYVYPFPLFFLPSGLWGEVEGGWIWKGWVAQLHLEEAAPQLTLLAINTPLKDSSRRASH